MNYLKQRGKYLGLSIVLCVFLNLYFLLLVHDRKLVYLFYVDFLLIMILLAFTARDIYRFLKFEKEKKRLLGQETVIYAELSDFENREVAEHDVRVLNGELNEKFRENCDLQDYVAKWSHEVKIPLSAALLMNEKMADAEERQAMKEQLERIRQQLNSMLLGCRLQSAVFDLRIRKTSLEECIRTSIRNNQFFLIQKRFSLDIRTGAEMVYTDRAWLVYILDQLISNAVKYAKDKPKLCIWTEKRKDALVLFVEDNGEGIRREDIRRIFDKGFTGGNRHNGKYKSTGMGLYLVSRIADKLGIMVTVESEPQEYTRFQIRFSENDFYMT